MFFHSICATDFKFGAKNNVRIRQSTLKTLIFVEILSLRFLQQDSSNIGLKSLFQKSKNKMKMKISITNFFFLD